MTKLALIADIHGNAHALEAVLEDIRRQKADRVYVLGDIVFKGPLPEKCVQIVRGLKTVVLQGNIDELVGTGRIQPGFAKSSEHEAQILEEMAWTRARLSEDDLKYLAGLPFQHTEELTPEVHIRSVHATPHNLLDILPPTAEDSVLESMFAGSDAKIAAYAHIHQPYIRCVNGRTVVNTGSVGLPFDGDPQASYAMIEADGSHYSITIRRVAYDLEGAVAAFTGSGHPFADSVIAGLRAGRRPV